MCPRQAAQPERGLGWHSRMSGGWPPRAAPRMPRSSAGCPRDGFMRAPTGVPACVLGRLHQRPRVLPPLPPQIKFVTDRDGNPAKLGAGAQGVVYKARRCCNLQLLASGASFQWAVPAAACVGRAAQRPVTSPGQAALPHTNRCVTWCMGMCGGRCSPCPILPTLPHPALSLRRPCSTAASPWPSRQVARCCCPAKPIWCIWCMLGMHGAPRSPCNANPAQRRCCRAPAGRFAGRQRPGGGGGDGLPARGAHAAQPAPPLHRAAGRRGAARRQGPPPDGVPGAASRGWGCRGWLRTLWVAGGAAPAVLQPLTPREASRWHGRRGPHSAQPLP